MNNIQIVTFNLELQRTPFQTIFFFTIFSWDFISFSQTTCIFSGFALILFYVLVLSEHGINAFFLLFQTSLFSTMSQLLPLIIISFIILSKSISVILLVDESLACTDLFVLNCYFLSVLSQPWTIVKNWLPLPIADESNCSTVYSQHLLVYINSTCMLTTSELCSFTLLTFFCSPIVPLCRNESSSSMQPAFLTYIIPLYIIPLRETTCLRDYPWESG